MSNSSHHKLFHSLDGIRGVAAILVVTLHMNKYFEPVFFHEAYLAVDLFFLLSGVVLANAYEHQLYDKKLSAFQFGWIRAVRIYPLYILGIAIATASVICGIEKDVGVRDLWIFLPLAMLVLPRINMTDARIFPLNGVSWTLFLELAINFFYGTTIKFLTNRVLTGILLISIAGLLTGICLSNSHWINLGWTSLTFPFGFFRVAFSFFAGVLLYRQYARASLSPPPPAIKKYLFSMPWIVLSVITILLLASPSETERPYFESITVFILFPTIIYLALFFQPSGIGARICEFLGSISYPIYALHGPLGNLIKNAFESRFHEHIENYAPWSGIVFLGILLPLCWLIQKYYDAPVRKILSPVFVRRK